MTDKKTKSLTLPTSGADLVARMREMHDLDTPRPSESSDEAQQPGNAETPQRNNVETQERSNAEALTHSNAQSQQRSNTGTLPRESAETPQHRNIEAQQPGNTETLQHNNADALERTSAPTRQPRNAVAPQRGSETSQQRSNIETQKRANAETQKRTSVEALRRQSDQDDGTEGNPVHQAIRQALKRPYSADLNKAPSTVTTIRIPTEVWERLDMASALNDKTKQDIVAEALMRYLTKIGRGEA